MQTAFSFPPLEGRHAHTLILGTMPGIASLTENRYYAHPRNAFWPIMLAILQGKDACFLPDTSDSFYEHACLSLTNAGFAVWDVLASCDRQGSLDSHIKRNTEQPNDLMAFIKKHPELRCIAFNGRTAEKLFQRHILKTSHNLTKTITFRCLPSSSPAMASLTLAQKHHRWQVALLPVTGASG